MRTLKYHLPSHIAFRETVIPRTSAVWLGGYDRVYSWVQLCLSVRYAVKLAWEILFKITCDNKWFKKKTRNIDWYSKVIFWIPERTFLFWSNEGGITVIIGGECVHWSLRNGVDLVGPCITYRRLIQGLLLLLWTLRAVALQSLVLSGQWKGWELSVPKGKILDLGSL